METKTTKYCEQLAQAGIENVNEMRVILNYLEAVAQICYDYYISFIKIRGDD